jgi:hypothetical protein
MAGRYQATRPGAWRPVPATTYQGGGRGYVPSADTDNQWHPTVANLAVLIILEITAYLALRWVFRTANGG